VTDEVEQTTETEPTLLPTPKPTRRNRPYANTDSTATDGVEEETKEQQANKAISSQCRNR